MLKDCLHVFAKELDRKSMKWLLDNYIPKDGTYLLINMDKGFQIYGEPLQIKMDKNTRKLSGTENSNYELISYLDYYSRLVEMNKPVDSKKIIHSNNFYSFFIKKENIQTDKLKQEVIDGYYEVFQNPLKKYKNRKARSLYGKVETKLGKLDEEELSQIHSWIGSRFFSFINENDINTEGKEYLKLFFIHEDKEKTKEMVEKEGKRYLLSNLFNSNDYNIEEGENTYGLPSNNMGMNSKKPFLESKSKKVKVPVLMTEEEALLQNQFFDYLAGQAAKGKNDIYIDLDEEKIYAYGKDDTVEELLSSVYLRIQPGKELEIHYTDIVSGYNPNLNPSFELKNVVSISDKMLADFKLKYGKKTKLYELEALVDEVFYGKKLKYNYFTKPDDITFHDNILKDILLTYRSKLWSWFRQDDISGIPAILDDMADRLILDSIQKGYNSKAMHQFNLWISIKDYLNDNRRLEESMVSVRENLRKHINQKEDWEFSSLDEYFYAVGQAVNLFVKLNRSAKKNLSFVNPVLVAKSDRIIKNRLDIMFRKYNYAIKVGDVRITNLIGHVLGYDAGNTKVNRYMIEAGFLDPNLVYEKAKQNDTESEKTNL